MGIYDRCEKDIKNCRPHSLKPEEGLLMIDKDFSFLSAFILNQRGQNHKDNENAGSLYMKQSGYVLERLCLSFILLFAVYITLH